MLKSLSMKDCKLKYNMVPILHSLAKNRSLRTVDFSGNYFGDTGSTALAAVLFSNTTLENISWDNNLVTNYGLREIAAALQVNSTIVSMPVPLLDIMTMMKAAAEDTVKLVAQYQKVFATRLRTSPPTPGPQSPVKPNTSKSFDLHPKATVRTRPHPQPAARPRSNQKELLQKIGMEEKDLQALGERDRHVSFTKAQEKDVVRRLGVWVGGWPGLPRPGVWSTPCRGRECCEHKTCCFWIKSNMLTP